MVDDPEEFLAYLTHLRAAHRDVDQRLRRIEREWIGGHGEVHSQVIRDLEALRKDLAHHFEEEESGGCLDEVVSRRPSLGHEADRLEREHPELLGQMDGLIVKLKGLMPYTRQLDEAAEAFRRFVERLQAHESAENRVLEESFGVDLE